MVAGSLGDMRILEGNQVDTIMVSLAARGDTVSKPIVLHTFKNKHYSLEKMITLISELSGLHYYFKTVK